MNMHCLLDMPPRITIHCGPVSRCGDEMTAGGCICDIWGGHRGFVEAVGLCRPVSASDVSKSLRNVGHHYVSDPASRPNTNTFGTTEKRHELRHWDSEVVC